MTHTLLIVLIFSLLLLPSRADAYIDLGLAGSVFLLLYIIGIAIVAFVMAPVLFFWKNIVRLLRRLWRRKEETK